MATLVNVEQPGIAILATHRVLAGQALPDPSEIERRLDGLLGLRRYPFHGEVDRDRVWRDFEEDLRIEGTAGPCFGIFRSGDRELLLLVPRERQAIADAMPGIPEPRRAVDVSVLSELLLPRLLDRTPADEEFAYVRGAEAAWRRVLEGSARTAVFVNPPRLEQVFAAADAGETMPAKSTDFFPKLATGIVMHQLEGFEP